MHANLKSGSALAALVCIAVGLMTSGASAVTARVAKKCEALSIKAYPPRESGNPAAGVVNGTGSVERDYYNKCVANGGNMPTGPDGDATPRAAGENGIRVGDTVRFPSGGPVMKVISIQGDSVICQWTTDAGQVVSGTIPTVALTAAGDSGGAKVRQDARYTYKPCPSSVAINGRNLCI